MCNETTKKNSVDEVTTKISNSLMKKTKAQLVEIILRKDEVERNIRADLKGTERMLDDIRVKYALSEKSYAALKTDYQDYCDESVSIRQELTDKVQRYMTLFYILLAVSAGLVAYIIF